MTELNDEDFVTQAFRSLQDVDVSARLSRSVATIPLHHQRKSVWPWGRIWQPLLALGISAAFGIYSGTLVELDSGETTTSEASTASMGSPSDDMETLFSFAWGSDWSSVDAPSGSTTAEVGTSFDEQEPTP